MAAQEVTFFSMIRPTIYCSHLPGAVASIAGILTQIPRRSRRVGISGHKGCKAWIGPPIQSYVTIPIVTRASHAT